MGQLHSRKQKITCHLVFKPRYVIYRELLLISRELCYKAASHHQNIIIIIDTL